MKIFPWAGLVVCLLLGPVCAPASGASQPRAKAQASVNEESTVAPPAQIRIPSVRQQLKAVPASVTRSDGHEKAIQSLLNEATARQEVDKVNCIYDKWNQARGLQQLAQTAKNSFEKAHRQNERREREHFYRKVIYLEKKMAELEAEARMCGTQEAREKARTAVRVIESGGEGVDESDAATKLDLPTIPVASPYR